jgi:acetyltransferase-like isoleucine patch superfamily enzyme
MKRKGISRSKTKKNPIIKQKDFWDLWLIIQRNLRKKWKRVLPLGDAVVDRWEKARFLGFESSSSIYDSSLVFGDVQVGRNTWIGPFTVLDGSGHLKIGANCSISAGVQIYTHDSIQWAISGGKKTYEYAPTTIEDNCYIGPNSVIQKGACIGKGTIVGANSFVNKSFPQGSKIAGNPAKSIKQRNRNDKSNG